MMAGVIAPEGENSLESRRGRRSLGGFRTIKFNPDPSMDLRIPPRGGSPRIRPKVR